MRESAREINSSGVTLSKSKVDSVTRKYIVQYNKYTEKLFDLSYISSPSYFDEDEFFSVFFDEFENTISLFCGNLSGKMIITPERIDFVLKCVTDNDVKLVLEYVKKVMEAKKALSDIAELVETVKFKKKSDLLNVKSRFALYGGILDLSKVPLDSRYVFECYSIDDDCEIINYDFSFAIYRTLLRKLNIDDNVALSDDALFLGKNFKIEDECKYLKMLLDGELCGNGKYSNLLTKTLEEHYNEYYINRTTSAICKKYSEIVLFESQELVSAYISKFKESITQKYKTVFMDEYNIYFAVKTDNKKLSEPRKFNDFYIGSFLVNAVTGERLGLSDRVLGLCGEFVDETDVIINNFKTYGSPICLHKLVNKSMIEKNYYPIYNVRKVVNGKEVDIYPHLSVDTIKFKDYNKVLGDYSLTENNIIDEVSAVVKRDYGTHTKEFKKLVGYLFWSFICVDCDHTLEGHNSPSHVILGDEFDWVNESVIVDAAREVEYIYNLLKL